MRTEKAVVVLASCVVFEEETPNVRACFPSSNFMIVYVSYELVLALDSLCLQVNCWEGRRKDTIAPSHS